ncbi:MAG: hypothetical protein P8Y44_11815 [Acidobacteriota bacterium]
MPKFLIEMRHSSEYEGCVRALDAIVVHGSHIISKAEWGCEDGVHSGWLIADLDSREEAMQLVPPEYRKDTTVVKLRTWSRSEIEAMMGELEA